jgi:hypothetical protein
MRWPMGEKSSKKDLVIITRMAGQTKSTHPHPTPPRALRLLYPLYLYILQHSLAFPRFSSSPRVGINPRSKVHRLYENLGKLGLLFRRYGGRGKSLRARLNVVVPLPTSPLRFSCIQPRIIQMRFPADNGRRWAFIPPGRAPRPDPHQPLLLIVHASCPPPHAVIGRPGPGPHECKSREPPPESLKNISFIVLEPPRAASPPPPAALHLRVALPASRWSHPSRRNPHRCPRKLNRVLSSSGETRSPGESEMRFRCAGPRPTSSSVPGLAFPRETGLSLGGVGGGEESGQALASYAQLKMSGNLHNH